MIIGEVTQQKLKGKNLERTLAERLKNEQNVGPSVTKKSYVPKRK